MDTTEELKASSHSARSLKSSHGNYPVWMSNRQIQKAKHKKKSNQGKITKKGKNKKYL